MLKYLRFGIPAFVALLVLVGFGISFAAGTGPGDAVLANGASQTVAPHSSVWYQFQYGGKNKPITVTMDSGDASNLRFGVYTPENIAAWQAGTQDLKAIGNGGPVQNHALGWSGQFPAAGTYYVVVYNDGDAAPTVQVTATGDNVTNGSPTPLPQATTIPNPFPVFTPVGKGVEGKIAFLDAEGGKIFTVNGDGTNLQNVSFGLDPQWNHTGTQIAFARQGPIAGVYTINADGSNEHLLYNTTEPRAPDWSPDDSQLVFSRMTGQKGGGQICFRGRCFTLPANVQWKLGLLNSSDGTYKDLPTTDHAFTPSWDSSNVNNIAYNDTMIGVIVTSPTGTPALTPIIGDLRPGVGTYDPLKILSPQYSPDGTKIVLGVAQPPSWQIAIANADGSERHLLTSMDPSDFTHANNVAPVFSPDGKQIMFLSDRNGKWEIFVMNADGTNTQQVLKNVTDQIPLTYNYQGERMLSWTK